MLNDKNLFNYFLKFTILPMYCVNIILKIHNVNLNYNFYANVMLCQTFKDKRTTI